MQNSSLYGYNHVSKFESASERVYLEYNPETCRPDCLLSNAYLSLIHYFVRIRRQLLSTLLNIISSTQLIKTLSYNLYDYPPGDCRKSLNEQNISNKETGNQGKEDFEEDP